MLSTSASVVSMSHSSKRPWQYDTKNGATLSCIIFLATGSVSVTINTLLLCHVMKTVRFELNASDHAVRKDIITDVIFKLDGIMQVVPLPYHVTTTIDEM